MDDGSIRSTLVLERLLNDQELLGEQRADSPRKADGHVVGAMRYSPTSGKYISKWKAAFPIDCLHYCFPGPADFWALALYNMMLNNPRFAL